MDSLRVVKTSNTLSNDSKLLKSEELNSSSVQSSQWTHNTIISDQIVDCLSFSCDKSSHNLLAFESNSRVFVLKLLISDDRFDTTFDYQLIQDFIIGVKCSSIGFSAETNTDVIDSCLKFAVATYDYDIRVIRSDLKSSEPNVDLVYLRQHSDFVNEIAFEPTSGHTLASVSDDCSCCLWAMTGNDASLVSRLTLTSAGVAVKWHQSDPNKLFIAEKKGIIRFYNCETKLPVMSCDCNRFPLLSADWSPNNSLFVGCVAGSDMFFWDTSLSSLPIDQRKGHQNGAQTIRFFDSNIIATRGWPNSTVRVQNLKTNQILLNQTMKVGAGIAWNCKIPILAVGANKVVHIFRFSSIL